jgi:uncharacterized membrane protein YhaH (DUF805 family)
VCGFFLLIIVGFLDAYTLYICVCVCVLCVIIIATEKKNRITNKENFCFVVMHGKTTELDFSSFSQRRDYLSVCVCFLCVSVSVIFSFEKQHTPTVYINISFFNG